MNNQLLNMRVTSSGRKKGAFTLIELLLVIFIISLLAAMASAALKKSYDVTLKMSCANNMRQLGLVCFQYMRDYHSMVVNSADIYGTKVYNVSWGKMIADKCGYIDWECPKNSIWHGAGIFKCPSTAGINSNCKKCGFSNYCISNDGKIENRLLIAKRWYTKLVNPSKKVLLCEGSPVETTYWKCDKSWYFSKTKAAAKNLPHMLRGDEAQCNIAYGDGHIGTIISIFNYSFASTDPGSFDPASKATPKFP